MRAIGVSNYTVRHLQELLSNCTVVPQVNQVEFHPRLYQKELLEYCTKNGITVEAYSPFAQGEVFTSSFIHLFLHQEGINQCFVCLNSSLNILRLLYLYQLLKKDKNPVIFQIAEKHKRSPSQILLRWGIQHKLGKINNIINRIDSN